MRARPICRLAPIIGLLLATPALASFAPNSLIDLRNEQALLAPALRRRIDAQNIDAIPPLHWRELRSFYAARGYKPVWIEAGGPNPKAIELRAVLLAARHEALNPDDYFPDVIAQSWHARSPSSLTRLELVLSEAFLRYSIDVSVGHRPPRVVDKNWHINPPRVDPVELLRRCVGAHDFAAALRSLPPPQAGYRRLRAVLAYYRNVAARGGWPSIPPGPTLHLGSSSDAVVALRERLAVDGDLEPWSMERDHYFDEAVKFAVERFQVRLGLKMDGEVGPATRAAMNVPITARIRQIELNMARWRWLPRDLGPRYIMVNTAGFELTAVDHGRPQLAMRAIIGKPARRTPVVAGPLRAIVLNPSWTVPPTIAFEDFVPAQRRNPSFLAARHIRVLANPHGTRAIDPASIDWMRVGPGHFPYILRQGPGPANPLGRIKFIFSNGFDIYLHDTPHRRLFDRRQRTFSAGCIRIAQPLRLAQWVMNGKHRWTVSSLRTAIATGRTRGLSPPHAIPVYVVYWTAWVGDHGGVYFRNDIYDSDCLSRSCPPRKSLKSP